MGHAGERRSRDKTIGSVAVDLQDIQKAAAAAGEQKIAAGEESRRSIIAGGVHVRSGRKGIWLKSRGLSRGIGHKH